MNQKLAHWSLEKATKISGRRDAGMDPAAAVRRLSYERRLHDDAPGAHSVTSGRRRTKCGNCLPIRIAPA